jgi:hypothetical protein
LWNLELGSWSFQRLVVPRGNAPRSSGYQPGALLIELRDSFDLRFHSETDRAEDKVQLPRLDSDTIWFVALAKEQLALIAENGLHGISFRFGLLNGVRLGRRFAKRTSIAWTLTRGGTGSSHAPVVLFQRCFVTADLQVVGRITSRAIGLASRSPRQHKSL